MVPEGWKVEDFSEAGIAIIDGDRGKEYPKESDFSSNGYCVFLTAKNVTKSGFRFEEVQFISEEKHRKLRKGEVSRGNIVLTTRGTVGQFGYFDEAVPYEIMRINSGMVVLDTSQSEISSDFLYAVCRSRLIKKQIESASFGSAQPALTVKVIKRIKVPIPPLPEQEKIAQILSTWDKAITATERLLENSRQRKKGLMQQLLTGKTRLPGFEREWESSILTEHCSVTTGKKDLQNKVENGEYPFFVRSSNIERIDSYSFDGEAILIPGDGRVGEIFHYIDGKFDFHQRVYKLSDFEGALGLFIYYYLKRFFKAEVIKNSVKATVDSLRMPVFTGMRIKLPSLEEQCQIVDVLSCSDKEVHAITQRLYLLKQEKKALMQQLLTGKRRVKVDAEAA